MNLLALPLLALLAAPTPAPAAAEPQLWWVFLTRGPNREGTKEQLEQGQKDHIANIVRLYEAGLAPLAGPVGSDGPLRGIILVRARSREELAAHLAPDPFVAGGRLNAEASPWTGSVSTLGKPTEGMQRTTLAILKKGPSWSAANAGAMSAEQAKTRERLRHEGALALDGDLTDGGDRLAALLFRTSDPARVEAMLTGDPAVKAGHYAVELHPQFIGKGMVGDEPPVDPRTP